MTMKRLRKTSAYLPLLSTVLISVVALLILMPASIREIMYSKVCSASDETCGRVEQSAAKPTTESILTEGKISDDRNSSPCVDYNPKCPQLVRQGECSRSPGWMIYYCSKSCNTCHLRNASSRCLRSFLNISNVPVYAPGELNTMFEQTIERFGGKYDVTIHSDSPWVVTFDNFLTDNESASMIKLVDKSWTRSQSPLLTEEENGWYSWCRRAHCNQNDTIISVVNKIQEITNIPIPNYEYFNIVRYEEGQSRPLHQDMEPRHIHLPMGPRILTFLLYLSDVEEGGETAFPTLGIAIKPKRNRVLLWPNALGADSNLQDTRTFHESKKLIKGTKYAANLWIHSHNFIQSFKWGCTSISEIP